MTMSSGERFPRGRRRTRPAHAWPVCSHSGKQRLGERKDVRLAIEAAQSMRSQALLEERCSSWTVVRGYRCDHCHGWHLTSQPGRRHGHGGTHHA